MIETIKQKKVTIPLEGGRQILVFRMKWKAARAFLKELGRAATALFKDGAGKPELSVEGVTSWMDKLPGLIASSDELIMQLLTSSTELKPEELDELDTLAVSAITQAAFEVNFDIELKNCWAGVLGVVADLLGSGKTTPTAESTQS